MSRLLYWNIRDFALNKIEHPQTRKKQKGSSLNSSEGADDRRQHILWLINTVNPDIFVLVETETAYDAPGRLVRKKGKEGALSLLEYLRRFNNDWMLVPPLQTGPNEGVSVYYRSTNRFFTGPYVWPGGPAVTAQPPGGGTGNYPASLAAGLPNPPRVIPPAAQHNGGANERQVAARVAFTYRIGHVNVGNAINFGTQRAPYMVTFTETNAMGAVVRNLTIFAVHSPASGAARDYLRNLANVAEITDGLAATEARVIAGDFNWNLIDPATNNERGSYGPLQAAPANYTLALRPVVPAAPVPTDGYIDYFATHIKSTESAEYWSTVGNPTFYPGYGYMGSTTVNNLYAIDNIFTRYGGGAGGPAIAFSIMNPVVGSPYNLYAVPFAGTPQGTRALAIEMQTAAFLAPPQQAPPFSLGLMNSFQGWENYGHIYSVSDHFALAIDL